VPVRHHRLLILSIAAVAAMLAVTAWLPRRNRPPGDAIRAGPGRPAPADKTQARARLLARLDAADAEAQRALAVRLDPLAARFETQRQQIPALADRLLGLPAQWRYLADRLPIGAGGRLADFLRDELRGTLFDPAHVRALIGETIAGYRQDERDIEDRLLVQLRLDLPDLPAATADDPAVPAARDVAAMGASVAEALRVELGHEAAALAAGEVLAHVALGAAARSGLGAASRASSVATLGVGLAAGLLAERAIANAWGDPRHELVRRLGRTLDALERELIEGHTRSPGLRPRLGRELRERAARRRSILLRATGPGGVR
jgi:hypothetical protein